jgi:hypothetical protein
MTTFKIISIDTDHSNGVALVKLQPMQSQTAEQRFSKEEMKTLQMNLHQLSFETHNPQGYRSHTYRPTGKNQVRSIEDYFSGQAIELRSPNNGIVKMQFEKVEAAELELS